MDPGISSQIITAAGPLAGAIVGSAATVFVQRSTKHQADRGQAADLLARVTNSATAVQTELAVYRVRRDSRYANGLALGQALLEMGAAWAEGNWPRGAASGVREIRTWDLAEAARFHERFAAAASDMNPALVHLSLMSPDLQQAATGVTTALAAVIEARKPDQIEAAGDALAEAVGGVRRAVEAFITRRWWRRKPRRRPATTAIERAPRSSAA